MTNDRSDILKPELQVHPREVQWYFIDHYYDGPISGLAWFHSHIYRFCCFQEDLPDHYIYVLHELKLEELAEELRDKARFEAMVGTHWSFDREGKPLPKATPPIGSLERYYQERKPQRCHEPRDRPVVAWFDTHLGVNDHLL